MNLTRGQFSVLSAIAEKRGGAYDAGILDELRSLDFIGRENEVNARGLAALEPYRMRRAIFIAAGFGSRMVPVTLNTPKPLVRVNGVRIIDTLLDAVLAAGITEIYIVRGWLGEQFDQLLYKYPMIRYTADFQ
jgi:hypothetical protein